MGHYDTFDPVPHRAHMRTLAYLRSGERVLEVGCSSGALTERIAAMGCRVTGIEVRPDAAERARRFAEDILVGDLTTMALALRPSSFDAILLIDVLEHVADPLKALRRLFPLLREGGRIVVAIPNVAHWSVRLRLLAGRFEYEDSGILDRTHLRFYTRGTARAMLEQAGLEIQETDLVPDVPLLRFKPRLAEVNYRVASSLPGLLATEFFFVGTPRRSA
jgi:2-polyprenyl-3-methyl-5-hydroxy-6-metoxy-1,4-benzoquinol methylase